MQLIQQEEASFSRNPLHLAAWKSDLKSIELLIETAKIHGLDLVNAIVTGDGNYGKTGTTRRLLARCCTRLFLV